MLSQRCQNQDNSNRVNGKQVSVLYIVVQVITNQAATDNRISVLIKCHFL